MKSISVAQIMKAQLVSMAEVKMTVLDLLRVDKGLKSMGYLRNCQVSLEAI